MTPRSLASFAKLTWRHFAGTCTLTPSNPLSPRVPSRKTQWLPRGASSGASNASTSYDADAFFKTHKTFCHLSQDTMCFAWYVLCVYICYKMYRSIPCSPTLTTR
ncbi:hypothetical protein ATCV1_Z847R [Acanthocystis turfacea chlorella virus 1]|uniref:Uncharacterized protein Z847R n=1 Tax=Chlorovirus heliozoae TaxID=322019 RepID=A7KAA7_9PHYC|nr:hypothetical protein ATCV1_Z847R [Acanthocystis turfacea chlorella virus 1]ABT16981.1 hypothetical protein ATCV1_Z847R [Acanthocystis turfacea chlorella virus 1]